jgi:adenylosuccinate synthase
MVNGLTHLAITKMDVMDSFESIQICTSYKIDGETVAHFPSQLSRLERVEPVYETMPGWKSSTEGITTWDALPQNARNYLQRLSDLLELPIGIVSLGPKRHQTIKLSL